MFIVFGAAVGLACGFGPAFLGVAGIFLKPMAASFNWSRADISFLPSLGLVGLTIGAPLLGFMADRIGWNKVIGFSIGFFSLGLLALSVAPPSYAYIIVIGILAGLLGAATTPAGYISVISRAFDRRLGMALGFSTFGVGLGATGMPVLAGMLLEVMDWRQAYACFAGICLVLGLAAYQLIFRNLKIIESASRHNQTSGAAKDVYPADAGVSFAQAIRSYRFWLIGFVAALVIGTTTGGYIHLASYSTDRGISPALAAQSAGLMGLGMALARVGVGLILDKIFAPLVAFCAFLVGAAGFYLLTADIFQSEWLLLLAAFLVGLSHGAEGDFIPFFTRKYFGVRAFGSIYGALYALVSSGMVIGAYVFGWSFDLLKSYIPMLQVSAILMCACSVAILALGPYRFPSGKALPLGAKEQAR